MHRGRLYTALPQGVSVKVNFCENPVMDWGYYQGVFPAFTLADPCDTINVQSREDHGCFTLYSEQLSYIN